MSSFVPQHTAATVLCCVCGTAITANPSMMCVMCIRGKIDITEGIPKQLTVQWCRGCNRYLQPPSHWVYAELESKELLTICIKRIKGLNNQVKLVDAGFVWTEPHSKRIKVKLTVQSEVFNGTILQQVFVIEYVVQSQQCDKCTRLQAKDTWNAVAQVRQKVEHKRTFFFLEQLILKHNAHTNSIGIKQRPDGLDFFFATRSHCLKFVDFLQAVTPLRTKTSEQLVSQDDNNNTYNYKYTFSVEIVPLCREDLVCLPVKTSLALGSIGPLVLVYKISNLVHILDPFTLNIQEISPKLYYDRGEPFRSISTQKYLTKYTVLDITPLDMVRGKFQLADIEVARDADFGNNDITFSGRTHLGRILHPGDSVLGYDLTTANFNDSDLVSLKGRGLPDFLLVRKGTLDKKKSSRKKRHWKLKRMDMEEDETMRKIDKEREEQDYEDFLGEIEADKEMRTGINLYREPNAEEILHKNRAEKEQEVMVDEGEEDADDQGDVGLEELLEDFDINEEEEEEDVE
eukprot:TRINITY_DN1830_c0_g2_i1.p1 TRINITY_DN1830_c0_g2~~TRINITY_DN1830_c0_g2_i1.p1  ORF type:complete len:515 (+),score=107.78 TRINITY_DN1830_c0_g2_i1:197-1741(+)